MNFQEYQNAVLRTTGNYTSYTDALQACALGLAGESGEIADFVKKVMYHDHENNHEHIAEELGDLMWYISRMSTAIGYDLQDIAVMNIAKLSRRYPDGFDPERSKNRTD